MNLKELLIDYTDMQKEIKELEEKINKLEIKVNEFSVVEASSLKPPFQKQNIKVDHTDIKKKRTLNYYKSMLQERYDRLLEQQIKVEEFIDNLPNSRLRRIFTYRYLENCTWQKVAYKIGGGATEKSVMQEHIRYLNNL